MKRFKTAVWLVVLIFTLWIPRIASAQGAVPYLRQPLEGCYDVAVYGVGLYDGGRGTLTIDPPPGEVVLALMEWVGAEDTTPGGTTLDGTSTLTIEKRVGGSVVATQAVTGAPADTLIPDGSGGFQGNAGYDPKGFTNAGPKGWFAWNAELGPNAPGLIPAQFSQPITLAISAWDSPARQTNGASITLVYRTAPAGSTNCPVTNKIQVLTGIDTYHQSTNEDISELLVFDIDPAPIARTVRMFFSHAGTDRNQSACRGGAIWMAVGDSASTRPGMGNFVPGVDIVAIGDTNGDGTARGYGINGGVEIVNDPFTSLALPCTPVLNPSPDEQYAAGHPYPGGASSAPYRALSMVPVNGGDVGPPGEWGVVEVRVVVPPNTRWMAYQLESERDQNGESGGWVGNGIFAVIPTSTLGDRAWEDLNGNGLQDAGEPGLANVAVQLRNSGGAEQATATTSGAGLYQFSELAPGTYEVRFATPAGFRPTVRNAGGAAKDAIDSDIDPASGLTGPIELVPSEVDLTWDAGYYRPVTIGDFVWLDQNGDGIQNSGEPGLNGITVRLQSAGPDGTFGTGDDVTATTTTASSAQGNGYYLFADRVPGRFRVLFEPPANYRFTLPNIGDDSRDSDADPNTGQTQPFNVASGQQNLTIDAGLIQLSPDIRIIKSPDLQKIARGATAVFDITVENIGENRLVDVVVTDPLAPDCDEAVGALAKGERRTYSCRLENVDVDFVNVASVRGRDEQGNPVEDSDDAVVDVLPTVELIKLASPESRPEPGGVFDYILIVRNTSSEPVTITSLTDSNPLPTACLNLVGVTIRVGGARNCQYSLTHEQIDVYVNNAGVTVIDDEENQASDTATATVEVYDLPPTILVEKSANPTTVPASGGEVTFTATVFNTSIEPVTLFFFTDDIHGPLNGKGSCLLPQVIAVGGSYTCSFTEVVTPGNEGETDTITAKANDDEGNEATASDTATVMPVAAAADASVGDFVWNDLNTDGIQDAGEPGVAGVKVTLFTPDGTRVAETTTDANGFYRLSNLLPGEYFLRFLPSGGDFVSFSPLTIGSDRALDSDVFQENTASGRVEGRSATFVLGPESYDDTRDAGLVAPTAISLVRFKAESWADQITVTWETNAEVGTFGYHLHRGTSASRATAARITNSLIQGKGPDGGVYSYEDRAVIPGITYFYWLEEVADNGSTEYGPITVTVFSAQREFRVMLPMVER